MPRNYIHCITINEIHLERKDAMNAVIRISQSGDKFTVYAEIYSRPRDMSLLRKSCDSLEMALSSAREYTSILIEEGFTAIN